MGYLPQEMSGLFAPGMVRRAVLVHLVQEVTNYVFSYEPLVGGLNDLGLSKEVGVTRPFFVGISTSEHAESDECQERSDHQERDHGIPARTGAGFLSGASVGVEVDAVIFPQNRKHRYRNLVPSPTGSGWMGLSGFGSTSRSGLRGSACRSQTHPESSALPGSRRQ